MISPEIMRLFHASFQFRVGKSPQLPGGEIFYISSPVACAEFHTLTRDGL
jgi:hypothetical protein